jgi:hypothetical protein
MLAAVTAEGHSPAVARKPSMHNRTRAVRKGVKVAFDARRVEKKMSIGSIYA